MEEGSPAASHLVSWSGWKSLLNTVKAVKMGVRKRKTVGGADNKGGSEISEHLKSPGGCF